MTWSFPVIGSDYRDTQSVYRIRLSGSWTRFSHLQSVGLSEHFIGTSAPLLQVTVCRMEFIGLSEPIPWRTVCRTSRKCASCRAPGGPGLKLMCPGWRELVRLSPHCLVLAMSFDLLNEEYELPYKARMDRRDAFTLEEV